MKAISGTLALRHMTEDDVEWAQRLANGAPQAPHWPVAAYLAAVDPTALPMRIALVAESPEELRPKGRVEPRVGFAVASLVPPQAELETVVVAPAVRRHGLGAALMRAMADELKSAGVAEVTLEVRGSNRPALALYRSLGLVEAGSRTGYYIDPVEDAVLMRLDLT